MRISELARSTGVALPTVKYYLREGLLPPGRLTAATQAEYDQAHVSRLRLIRALVGVGGLSLTSVRSVLAAIDAGPDQLTDAVARAHDALGPTVEPITPGVDPGADPAAGSGLELVRSLGWQVDPDSSALRQLDAAVRALRDLGLEPALEAGSPKLATYAKAALEVAQQDIEDTVRGSTSLTGDPASDTVAYVVLGTVLYEPVLLALRRLAQQHVYLTAGAAR